MIAATLGVGTLTFPYIIMENGLIGGSLLVLFGALVSYYTGLLVVICQDYTGKFRLQDIAQALFGRKMALLTSIAYLSCLLGFVTSNIVYVILEYKF